MNIFKFLKSEEWKLLWPFYLTSFLSRAFALVGPIWIVYFAGKGFSFFQISLSLAAFYLAIFIFEVPTGAIADFFGRKPSVVLSVLVEGLLFFCIPFIKTFPILLITLFTWGFVATLASGADEAWVVDWLKHKKRRDLTQNYFIKTGSIRSVGLVIGALLCGIFAKLFGLDALWFIQGSVIGLACSFILLIFGKEYFERKKVKIKNALNKVVSNTKKGIKYSIKHYILSYLILAGIFVYFAYNMVNIVWQPFLTGLGMPVHYLGYLFAMGWSFGIVLPYLSKRLLRKIGKEKHYFALLLAIDAILCLIIYFVMAPLWGMIIFVISFIPFILRAPIEQNYFQRFVPSKIRATVGSFKSMVETGSGAIALVIAGLLADTIGPRLTIVCSAFIMVPAIIFYLKIKEKM